MAMRPSLAAVLCVIGLTTHCSLLSSAFYLPGVAPTQFHENDPIELKVKELDSVKTQLPIGFYQLPFCAPTEVKHFAENLGEILDGDRIENSMYEIKMGKTETCKVLCATPLDSTDAAEVFSEKILSEYRVNWIVDNLPAAVKYYLTSEANEGSKSDANMFYERGFPLGFVGGMDSPNPNTKPDHVFINNHVTIRLLFHTDQDSFKGSRIVGFEVEPRSIRHVVDKVPESRADQQALKLESCVQQKESMDLTETKDSHIIWTYDVVWEASSIKWASRWDVYLKMTDSKIHWFSIINSLMIVLFLSGMVAMIMMRTLHRDFRRYNELEQDEETQQEETGWKLVHGDVFRPPQYGGLFSILVGSGVQVLMMSLVTLFFSVLGFLSPANRGGLMTALVLLFVFMGVFAGFYSARVYKMFGLLEWRRNTLLTSLALPGVVFSMFFFLNLFVWGEDSSGAVPFGTMFALLVLWFGISVPLVYLGSYFGYKKPALSLPVKVNQIPRQIPPQSWYMKPLFSVLVGGMLPFGAVFIEIFFIMSSIWLHRFYYMFGFLFIVFFILVLTCAEITIVMTYFQLCSEDYNWWWRSFFTSGSSALYLFAYSCLYFTTNLHVSGFVSGLLFFGYMSMISLAFFLATGTIGFAASLWFAHTIYSNVKID